jgi:hypothetical protein
MPLDIDRLYSQVEKMAVTLPGIVPARQLADAQAFFREADLGLSPRRSIRFRRSTVRLLCLPT